MQDKTMPKGKWEFDHEVTAAFDDMLKRSIPQYDVMRQACFDIGKRFVTPKSDIVDMGCARGEALQSFVEKFGAYNRFIGIETSKPMLEASRKRFEGYINTKIVSIRDIDLRNDWPPCEASVVLSVLTLQFTPIEYRQRILRNVYNDLISGGAFILVEKVLGADADIDEIMVDTYLKMKAINGYTGDQIERKRLSLEGVLVPLQHRGMRSFCAWPDSSILIAFGAG